MIKKIGGKMFEDSIEDELHRLKRGAEAHYRDRMAERARGTLHR